MSYETQYHDEKYDPSGDLQFEIIGQHGSRNSDSTSDPWEAVSEAQASGASVEFTPYYYPERVIQDKERDLMREKGICLGEYVNDVGAKNREFRVTGKIRTPELEDFHKIIDYGEKYQLVCMQWQGEVLIEDSELEGPVGVDAGTRDWMYEYQLDLVSTGADEQHQGDHGIISRGNSMNDDSRDFDNLEDDDSGFMPGP